MGGVIGPSFEAVAPQSFRRFCVRSGVQRPCLHDNVTKCDNLSTPKSGITQPPVAHCIIHAKPTVSLVGRHTTALRSRHQVKRARGSLPGRQHRLCVPQCTLCLGKPPAAMDVTIDNFDEVLPVFEDALRKAHFVAIDLEFTGLRTSEMMKRAYVEPVRCTWLVHVPSGQSLTWSRVAARGALPQGEALCEPLHAVTVWRVRVRAGSCPGSVSAGVVTAVGCYCARVCQPRTVRLQIRGDAVQLQHLSLNHDVQSRFVLQLPGVFPEVPGVQQIRL